jgi:glycolate oxidase iron-sulfur subunit
MYASPPARSSAADIAELTDQCVLCGLCLPACPTYRVAHSEAESPRGRISLIKAMAEGQLPADADSAGHLDHCLGCLSCERACPSGVQYGRLLSLHRERSAPTPDRQQRLLYGLVARPRLLRGLAWLSHGLGLSRWLAPLARRHRAAGGWRRWIAQIPPLPSTAGLVSLKPASGERGRIGLFLGCMASAFDRDTHAAARRLLTALGHTVVEPAAQGCCGALALQAGHRATAESIAAPTRRAFVDVGVTTVLISASGCFASLRDLALAGSGIAVREIGEFLAADARLGDLAFASSTQRVALHRPCSLNNTVRAAAATSALLARIPQLDLVELPEQPRCCGAGGSHFLRHPAMADALRDERLDQLEHSGASLLLTSNIGCRLHLANGLRERGRAIDVLHPVTLLARQLKDRAAAPTPAVSRAAGAH